MEAGDPISVVLRLPMASRPMLDVSMTDFLDFVLRNKFFCTGDDCVIEDMFDPVRYKRKVMSRRSPEPLHQAP